MNRSSEFLSSFKKLSLFAVFAAMISSSLHADWVPEDCLTDLKSEEFNALNNQTFKNLKTQISEGLKGSWCTEEKLNLLMDLIYLTKPSTCVEIGAFTGSTVLPVASTLKFLGQGRIYAIDAWSNEEAIANLPENDPNKSWWASVSMKDVKSTYDQMIRTWHLDTVCTTLHSTSEQAVHQINEIDFLHLDGNFSEVGSLKDVQLYLPKVKKGGYVLLSNFFLMINGKQPKLKAFSELFNSCEMICEIERDNAVLFIKQ
jgi:hypothetical protein